MTGSTVIAIDVANALSPDIIIYSLLGFLFRLVTELVSVLLPCRSSLTAYMVRSL
jgi:hypothetical protein